MTCHRHNALPDKLIAMGAICHVNEPVKGAICLSSDKVETFDSIKAKRKREPPGNKNRYNAVHTKPCYAR